MNLERAAMRARLADAKEKKARAVVRGESLSATLRQLLNTALVAVENQEIAAIDTLVDDLLAVHMDIAECDGDIVRLTRGLA